jgi:hypothetical protein
VLHQLSAPGGLPAAASDPQAVDEAPTAAPRPAAATDVVVHGASLVHGVLSEATAAGGVHGGVDAVSAGLVDAAAPLHAEPAAEKLIEKLPVRESAGLLNVAAAGEADVSGALFVDPAIAVARPVGGGRASPLAHELIGRGAAVAGGIAVAEAVADAKLETSPRASADAARPDAFVPAAHATAVVGELAAVEAATSVSAGEGVVPSPPLDTGAVTVVATASAGSVEQPAATAKAVVVALDSTTLTSSPRSSPRSTSAAATAPPTSKTTDKAARQITQGQKLYDEMTKAQQQSEESTSTASAGKKKAAGERKKRPASTTASPKKPDTAAGNGTPKKDAVTAAESEHDASSKTESGGALSSKKAEHDSGNTASSNKKDSVRGSAAASAGESVVCSRIERAYNMVLCDAAMW